MMRTPHRLIQSLRDADTRERPSILAGATFGRTHLTKPRNTKHLEAANLAAWGAIILVAFLSITAGVFY